MRRRQFLTLSGMAAIGLPWPARAQKERPLVAVLVPGTAKLANDRLVAIRKGMQEAGLTEGVNYSFALRYADGVFDRLPGLAQELAALKPRVIVASAASMPPRFWAARRPPTCRSSKRAKFVLVVNLKTAKSLGITVPDRLLTVADEVIE